MIEKRILLTETLANIEQALYRHWPLEPYKCSLWLQTIARYQAESSAIDDQAISTITAPLYDLLERGGKRWRPLVMALTAHAFGLPLDEVVLLTPVVEIPHNGSLIIDDIEDKSVLRRGKSAIHLQYGLDFAINSANLAYFSATAILDEWILTHKLSSDVALAIYQSYAKGLSAVHIGQGMDIAWHQYNKAEDLKNYLPTKAQYQTMCKLKTGSLVAMGAEIAMLAAGKSRDEAIEMGFLWQEIGFAFQIIDDVLNVHTGVDGKALGDDIVEGKKSLPLILFFEQASQFDDSLMQKYYYQVKTHQNNPTAKAKAIANVIELFAKYQIPAQSRDQANAILSSAKNKLLKLVPQSDAREALLLLVESFLEKVTFV